jgi:hypothetical protein
MPEYTFRCGGTCSFYTTIEAATPLDAVTHMLADDCHWQVDRDEGEERDRDELNEWFDAYDNEEGVSAGELSLHDYTEEAAFILMQRELAKAKQRAETPADRATAKRLNTLQGQRDLLGIISPNTGDSHLGMDCGEPPADVHNTAKHMEPAPKNREGLTYVEWLRAAGIEEGEKLRPWTGPYSISATMVAWKRGEDPAEWRNDDRVRL